MHLSWRDWLATALVAAASVYYVMFAAGSELLGASSPKLVAGVTLVLGFISSFTAVVYGVGEGLMRANKVYLAITSVLGLAALVTGLIALFTGNEAALAGLVASTVVLWVMSTVRHALLQVQDRAQQGAMGGALPGAA